MTTPKQRAELARVASEIDEARPYLELAREIQAEVARVVADPDSEISSITEAIEQFPRDERLRVARAIFDRLPHEHQWSILEALFDDDELRGFLEAERAARVAAVARDGHRLELVRGARSEDRLDTAAIPAHETLTLGLFREREVAAAVLRGHVSDSCARQVGLRCVEPGRFRVIDDVFNPTGGYFVSAEYDETTWRSDRLAPHAFVRVGSISEGIGFELALYPGARVDFEREGQAIPGRLHLGFAMLGDRDVFAG